MSDLAQLREATAGSYRWRKKGRVVPAGTKGARYECDPRLLCRLVAAEQAETVRLFNEGAR